MTRDLPHGVPSETKCAATYTQTSEYVAAKVLSLDELSRLYREVAPFWQLARGLSVILEDGLLDVEKMHAAVLAAKWIKLCREAERSVYARTGKEKP